MICLHVNWKVHVACNFSSVIETEGLSGSHVVTYTINVVMSWKLCKLETFLLHSSNRK